MSQEKKKIYIPYDYRVMMRGFYEVEVDAIDYDKTFAAIRDGEIRDIESMKNVNKLPAEELFTYDNYQLNKPISESDFADEDYLKNIDTKRGFTAEGRRETPKFNPDK
jgi:hypothetical protein